MFFSPLIIISFTCEGNFFLSEYQDYMYFYSYPLKEANRIHAHQRNSFTSSILLKKVRKRYQSLCKKCFILLIYLYNKKKSGRNNNINTLRLPMYPKKKKNKKNRKNQKKISISDLKSVLFFLFTLKTRERTFIINNKYKLYLFPCDKIGHSIGTIHHYH